MVSEHERVTENGWRRFWDRGGWWKAVLAVVAYATLYEGFGFFRGTLFRGLIDKKDILADPQSVFFGLALPILLGGVVLMILIATLGWGREIFGRQPIKGSGWMWLAVVIILIPIVMRVAATKWSAYSTGVILTTLLTGVFIGFVEELLTRGIAVNLLRRAGYGEKAVLVLSSLLFSLLHSVNVFSGQSPLAVGITVVYTFGFGVMMYLVLRVTRSIIWPMLLHAATDPTTILAAGGVDTSSDSTGSTVLISAAGIFNYLYLAVAILAIILVKGKVYADRSPRKARATTDS
jgi:membrane protease YdiL (CAAX protease family)